MFANTHPAIVQIRRELRGQLPDEWLEEVVSILEYQLTYQTLDELATNDRLKLMPSLSFSRSLQQLLSQALAPDTQALAVSLPLPQSLRLPWQ
ncbi:hypothetical protein H6F86_23655 [Phormidium sp. FACHB-592]|uniref:Uncharacterized protein n=1 Tax=Stenomitos frigidus AS-A4 TaxID=2933935 RepID=A0ABV0KUJ6_9CYAN|nr:hypothetical protein [Phormidium sp. FACHB-592]MBD2076828.1 hypothetical protein [Phormidium sp. FACHB-592]